MKLVKPTLERVALAKPDAWLKRMTGITKIEAAIDGAGKLLGEVKDAETSNDEVKHVTATQKLTEWNKTANTYDGLMEASRKGVEKALREGYAKFKSDLDQNINLNLSAYPKSDENTLKPLMAQLAKDKQAIVDALSGGNPAVQMVKFDELSTIQGRLVEFKRLREVARDNRQKAHLVKGGVSSEQAQRIANMRQKAPEVVESINAALGEAQKVIGDVEVTTKVIDDHKKLQDGHEKDWREAVEKIEEIKKANAKVQEDNRALEEKIELSFRVLLRESKLLFRALMNWMATRQPRPRRSVSSLHRPSRMPMTRWTATTLRK